MRFQNPGKLRFWTPVSILAVGTLLIGGGMAATNGETFATPEQAAKALVLAAQSDNRASAFKILGPSAKEFLVTTDPVADRNARQTFVAKAREKMRVVADPSRPSQRILEIGNDRWPFPIPIARTAAGRWHFDTLQGRRTVMLRRIGHNELTALDLSRGYVEAQNEYFEKDRMGTGVRQYAQKFISSPDEKDGLFWKSTDPDDESPIAEFVGKAIAEGYTKRGEPYHGYFFKILKAQGPHAAGGAMDYMEDGAMTKGFAMIAWPSGYRSTGVKTFLVDRSGIVYEKDLGPKTGEIANAMTVYDPDQTWSPVSGSGVPKPPEPVRTTMRHKISH